jgi:hypothetical protein
MQRLCAAHALRTVRRLAPPHSLSIPPQTRGQGRRHSPSRRSAARRTRGAQSGIPHALKRALGRCCEPSTSSTAIPSYVASPRPLLPTPQQSPSHPPEKQPGPGPWPTTTKLGRANHLASRSRALRSSQLNLRFRLATVTVTPPAASSSFGTSRRTQTRPRYALGSPLCSQTTTTTTIPRRSTT